MVKHSSSLYTYDQHYAAQSWLEAPRALRSPGLGLILACLKFIVLSGKPSGSENFFWVHRKDGPV